MVVNNGYGLVRMAQTIRVNLLAKATTVLLRWVRASSAESQPPRAWFARFRCKKQERAP